MSHAGTKLRASSPAAIFQPRSPGQSRRTWAGAIVLGCAGMADLAASLSQEHGLPMVDGVAAAVKLAEALSALRLRSSKLDAYASPRAK